MANPRRAPLAPPVSSGRAGPGAEHRRSVQRVIEVMRSRLAEGLSLQAMAEIAGLSPFHFVRVFRAVTGARPHEFLAALRLQEAKRLLLTTDLSVTDVCFEVGYSSLGTFSARFTRLVGVTPLQLRRLGEQVVESCVEPLRRDGEFLRLLSPDGGGVAGRIVAPAAAAGLIFVALFPTPVPQGRPVACTVRDRPGPYRIGPVPDGRYYVLAAAVPWPAHPLGYFFPGEGLFVGASRGAVQVRLGRAEGPSDVHLRPVEPTDPPIVVVSPFMLAERLSGVGVRPPSG